MTTRWSRPAGSAGPLSSLRRRLSDIGVINAGTLLALVAATVLLLLAPWLAPYGETKIVGSSLTPPSGQFLFGLDEQGRDVFSRVLIGARTSLLAAILVIASGSR